MTNRYLIIADDLTGANDTGVQLTKRNLRTTVHLTATGTPFQSALVLDTESRTLPPAVAYQQVKELTQVLLANQHFDLVYKKVDSTLRGNIAIEIKALCETYKPERIIFAPALPKSKRITYQGIQHLNGLPLMQTAFAHDPLTPLWTDHLSTLLASVFSEKISHYQTTDLTSDLNLTDAFIHSFDITSQSHLKTLATLVLSSPLRTLYVGSAGLAEALFTALVPPLPTLAVVGSLSQVSLAQMTYAEMQGIAVISIPPKDLLKAETIPYYQELLLDKLQNYQDVILTVSRTPADYEQTLDFFASQQEFDPMKISHIVKDTLATITKRVITEATLAGLLLSGGDTAIAVIQALAGTGCLIVEELSPGIVKSYLVGGPHAGLPLVTKAGAFGNHRALYHSLQKLKE